MPGMAERYDAIVVGAGIGGATCGALLARRGLRVLVLDKNSRPGGKAMTVSKNGFRYELWPIVGGPSLGSQFSRVLSELDMEQEVEILAPSDKSMLLYRRPDGQWARSVGSARPEDASRAATALPELLGLDPAGFAEAARAMLELVAMPPHEVDTLDDLSFAEVLARYRLPRSVISYWGMWVNIVFVVPLDLVAASEAVRTLQDFTRGGAGRYHAGGFGRLAEAFCQAVERFGGRVLLRTRAERIAVEDGAVRGVETERGRFEAPIVISNAGIQPTVLRLVGAEHFDRGYVSRVRELVPSWAIIGLRYFLDRPFFEHGMYIAFSDESYLDAARLAEIKAGKLPDEPLVFSVVPSVYDASLAPPGKQCALVGTICTPDPDFAHGEALLERLDATVRRVWPGIEGCIASVDRYLGAQVSSLTRDRAVPAQGGECIGLGQIVGQCGRHKPDPRTPVRGLYLVGCDAGGYGCGTHQAADSGVRVADLVTRQHMARTAL
jgi:phytoene dehydrogenase-like protein